MRLLHLDFDDLGNPWGGGQARRTYEVNRRLAEEKGWEITVVTGAYAGARPVEVPVSRGRLRYLRAGGGPFPLNVFSFLAAQPLLARRYAHDLLVEDFTTPVGPSGAPMWARRPVVGSAQFLFAAQMARKYGLPFDRAERALLRRYRWLVALTEVGAARLRAASAKAEVAVIPQGLAPEDFVTPEVAAADGSNGEYALYLGRLDVHQKGLDTLLRAWAAMAPEERPPLVLAGDGRDRRRLEGMALDVGLGERVRFVGRVVGEEKRRLLRGARLVCMPSRYETFGIAAIEALAAGKALVASDLAELREAVGAGAVLVRPEDAMGLAREVVTLWGDEERRRELGRRGRLAVEGLTWERVAEMQAVFYERVLSATVAAGTGNMPRTLPAP